MGLADNALEDIQGGEITLDLVLTAAIIGGLIFVGYEIYQAIQNGTGWLCNSFPTLCSGSQTPANNPQGLSSNAFSSMSGWLCTLTGIGCSTNATPSTPDSPSSESTFDGSGVSDDLTGNMSPGFDSGS
jgi:hypothetical protein